MQWKFLPWYCHLNLNLKLFSFPLEQIRANLNYYCCYNISSKRSTSELHRSSWSDSATKSSCRWKTQVCLVNNGNHYLGVTDYKKKSNKNHQLICATVVICLRNHYILTNTLRVLFPVNWIPLSPASFGWPRAWNISAPSSTSSEQVI